MTPNLYVSLYKLRNDEKTYMVLDASPQEQHETTQKILLQGWSDLDELILGIVPIQVVESYNRSNMPIPIADITPVAA